MKKTALLIILAMFLCFIVAAGFWLITQRGVLADRLEIINKEETKTLLSAGSGEKTAGLLLKAVKSTEKMESVPVNYSEIFILKVTYKPDIPMKYVCRYDPYTGRGCIEKGLIDKSYYSIPPETMEYLASPDRASLYKMTGIPNPETLDSDTMKTLASGLNYVNGTLGPDIAVHEYRINMSTVLNPDLYYKLHVDTMGESAYIISDSGYYELGPGILPAILSTENVYKDYMADRQPVPKISLAADITLVPASETIDWTRTTPEGREITENTGEDYNPTDQKAEPGTPLEVIFGERIPDVLTLGEYRDGSLFKEFDLLTMEASVPEFEGTLGYKLTAIYESPADSNGTITQDYLFNIEIPTTPVMVYGEVRPGDILAFRVDFAEEGEAFSIETNLRNYKADFAPYGDSMVVYVPVYWWTSPGEYYAKIYRKYEGERELFREYAITILPDNFITEYQYLEVSDELKEKTDPAKTINDGVIVREAKSNPGPVPYIEGTFIMPLDGELGTSYAMTRYINGENPYRHSGLDIDGETGDPIVACNNGVIVYAGPLVRPGNTVIIDHGMGLFSSYLHLSGFAVEAGDYVEKGDVVAYVGSTGFSTGPHLHWSVTLGGTYMSPLWLVNNPIVPAD